MRQLERDARQGRSADVPAADGGGIDVRELRDDEVARVVECLPLARYPTSGTYLIAWEDDEPLGHAHISWSGTKLGVPEVGDVYVREHVRRRGVAKALARAAEHAAVARGHSRLTLSYGMENAAARNLYEGLGYRDAGLEPERVQGPIRVRTGVIEVDEILVHLVKDLGS